MKQFPKPIQYGHISSWKNACWQLRLMLGPLITQCIKGNWMCRATTFHPFMTHLLALSPWPENLILTWTGCFISHGRSLNAQHSVLSFFHSNVNCFTKLDLSKDHTILRKAEELISTSPDLAFKLYLQYLFPHQVRCYQTTSQSTTCLLENHLSTRKT